LKKNKISKNWLIKQHKDPFFRQSKIQGYRSRSAFKLIEMNKKFKFLKKNTFLLDLGSSPGGWSQVVTKIITKGKILAVDIKPMESIDDVNFLKGDLCDSVIYEKICAYFDKKVDVIFITTPTSTHIKYIMEAIKFKKTIFCEKPLDLNINKINECKKFIKKYNPKIQVGFNRRYDPGHYALKKSIQIGEIGKLEKIIITSRDPAPPSTRMTSVSVPP